MLPALLPSLPPDDEGGVVLPSRSSLPFDPASASLQEVDWRCEEEVDWRCEEEVDWRCEEEVDSRCEEEVGSRCEEE
eukprot:gene7799-4113_t